MSYLILGIILIILNFVLVVLSKIIMYKIFKIKNYRVNLYFSSFLLTILSFGMFLLVVYVMSNGDIFLFSENLSSFLYLYLFSVVLFVVINFIFENKFCNEKRYVYSKKNNRMKKRKKKR